MQLFILHRPYQLYLSQLVLRQYGNIFFGRNILIYFGSIPRDMLDGGVWDIVRCFPSCDAGVVGEREIVEDVVKYIRELLRFSDSVRILFSSLEYPDTNRIFFSKITGEAISWYFISDGAASYVGNKITFGKYKIFVKRFIKGILGKSAKFHPYVGDSMGLGIKGISGLFCPAPELLGETYSYPIFPIALPPLGVKSGNGAESGKRRRCLFLDQPVAYLMSESAWGNFRDLTIKYLLAKGFDVIAYKPHPYNVWDFPRDLVDAGAVLLTNLEPVETMDLSEYSDVISYYSTVLINIKLMAGGAGVNVTALFPDAFENSRYVSKSAMARMLMLMERVGVNIVRWKDYEEAVGD